MSRGGFEFGAQRKYALNTYCCGIRWVLKQGVVHGNGMPHDFHKTVAIMLEHRNDQTFELVVEWSIHHPSARSLSCPGAGHAADDILGFSFGNGKITTADVIADPARLSQFDLAVLNE